MPAEATAAHSVLSLRSPPAAGVSKDGRREALLHPLALAEHRHLAAVGQNAVDIGLGRADHPVDMDQALVAALRRDLLRRELGAVDEAFRIALAERDVRRSVLVEQRVVEQQPALRE